MKDKTLNVIGLGYIGLPTAALLASYGNKVRGVDIDEKIICGLNEGRIHIFEPGLAEMVMGCIKNNSLFCSTNPMPADVHIICVPTPFKFNNERKEPDLSNVFNAISSLLPVLKCGDLIILESTSPIGTTKKISSILEENGFKAEDIDLAYCPERVIPGKIIKELKENNRVVGGINSRSTIRAKSFYEKIVLGRIFETNSETAEMCKLAENSFRDVNIAFANELSIICDKNKINVWELISLANQHPRVDILQPGPGVGGHCIAVDPWFLVFDNDAEAKLIKTAREVNENKALWVFNQIDRNIIDFEKKYKRKPVIACLGLSFKPDVDDIRESPALEIAQKVTKKYNNVMVVDPYLNQIKGMNLVDLDFALDKADLLVLLVNHKNFKDISSKLLNSKKILLNFCSSTQEEIF